MIEIGIEEKKENRNEVTSQKRREIWNEEGVWNGNRNEKRSRIGMGSGTRTGSGLVRC